MIIAVYQKVRQKDYMSAIFDDGVWITFLVGVLMFAVGALGYAPSAFGTAGLVLFILSVVAIFVMSGRASKGAKRYLKGAYNLYGSTGYLGDILSYARLLALGLATSVLGGVINLMATMIPGPLPVRIIAFVGIGIFGHILNLGINLIGCYVHTCRLQFVEFFGKFYEGGGKKFTPFSSNTKFFKFKEEI